jgi:hypothetical protein
MARMGNGTTLSSNINSKGDMAYLLFNNVSMTCWTAMSWPEEYLQRGIVEGIDFFVVFLTSQPVPARFRASGGRAGKKTTENSPHMP